MAGGYSGNGRALYLIGNKKKFLYVGGTKICLGICFQGRKL